MSDNQAKIEVYARKVDIDDVLHKIAATTSNLTGNKKAHDLAYHLFYIYTDSKGNQQIFRAGPEREGIVGMFIDDLKVTTMDYKEYGRSGIGKKQNDLFSLADLSKLPKAVQVTGSDAEVGAIFEKLKTFGTLINESKLDYKIPGGKYEQNSGAVLDVGAKFAGFKLILPKDENGREIWAPGVGSEITRTLYDRLKNGFQDGSIFGKACKIDKWAIEELFLNTEYGSQANFQDTPPPKVNSVPNLSGFGFGNLLPGAGLNSYIKPISNAPKTIDEFYKANKISIPTPTTVGQAIINNIDPNLRKAKDDAYSNLVNTIIEGNRRLDNLNKEMSNRDLKVSATLHNDIKFMPAREACSKAVRSVTEIARDDFGRINKLSNDNLVKDRKAFQDYQEKLADIGIQYYNWGKTIVESQKAINSASPNAIATVNKERNKVFWTNFDKGHQENFNSMRDGSKAYEEASKKYQKNSDTYHGSREYVNKERENIEKVCRVEYGEAFPSTTTIISIAQNKDVNIAEAYLIYTQAKVELREGEINLDLIERMVELEDAMKTIDKFEGRTAKGELEKLMKEHFNDHHDRHEMSITGQLKEFGHADAPVVKDFYGGGW